MDGILFSVSSRMEFIMDGVHRTTVRRVAGDILDNQGYWGFLRIYTTCLVLLAYKVLFIF